MRLRVVSAGMADHPQTACGGQLPPAGAESELNRIRYTSHCNLIFPPIRHDNFLLTKKRRNRFIIPFQSIQERENERMPRPGISIEIPINGIFRRNSILAYFDDPQYRRKSSGITKYGTVGLH